MKRKPFERPKLKVSRGRKHIAELEVEIATYLGRNPCVIFLERDRKTDERSIVLRGRESVPEAFTAIFGDAIHNLRVALDLMANDLVALSGAQPKQVYFPFANSAAELEGEIKRKMRGASPAILDLVRKLEPYKGGNIPLRALHDLDITDKHIDIITARVSVATGTIPMRQIPSDRPGRFTFEAAFGEFPTVPFDNTGYRGVDNERFENLGRLADREVTLRLAPGLPFEGKPPIKLLHHLAKMVDGIIETFEKHCLGD